MHRPSRPAPVRCWMLRLEEDACRVKQISVLAVDLSLLLVCQPIPAHVRPVGALGLQTGLFASHNIARDSHLACASCCHCARIALVGLAASHSHRLRTDNMETRRTATAVHHVAFRKACKVLTAAPDDEPVLALSIGALLVVVSDAVYIHLANSCTLHPNRQHCASRQRTSSWMCCRQCVARRGERTCK